MSDNVSMITIPGNIKQRLLPFVLDPSNNINKQAANSGAVGGKPQHFSFRKSSLDGNTGLLNICPSSFDDTSILDDISYALNYGKNGVDSGSNDKITLNDILNNIPGIQIREFLPDTRLDLCINAFKDFLGIVTDLFTSDKDKLKELLNKLPEAKQKGELKSFFTLLTEAMNWSLKYLTGNVQKNLYTAIQEKMKGNGGNTDGAYKVEPEINNYIFNFPYILYYRFQSCVTTNIYELPCIVDGNKMYSSEGKGWNGADNIALTNDFLGNIPVLGSLMKTILGNVRISYLPWWDSNDGQGTAEPEVTVKFDLFNDTAEAATNNFIFVNTIVQNNKWIQYNMFLHSSNLYDIKIEGYNRLFACTGKFEVQSAGILREMPLSWLKNLVSKHGNSFKMSEGDIKANKLIKIPDVYKVSMTFSSLLPANFNNFLYTYSKNKNQMVEYKDAAPHLKSVAIKIFAEGIKDFEERLKAGWKAKKFPEN